MADMGGIIKALYPKYLELLKELVEQESKTEDKEALDRVADIIESFSKKEGYSVERIPFKKAGDCLLITLNPYAILPHILFTGHMDTVHPRGSFGEKPFTVAGDRAMGPGITDMKGGIVIALMVMEALKKAGYDKRPVKLFLISDEELSEGLTGDEGRSLIIKNAEGAAAAFTMEGDTEDSVVIGRKGSIRYRVEVTGKAAHAGKEYGKGISAIKEACLKILEIEKESDPDNITYNCGIIEGGTSVNVVPEKCVFHLYNRYWKIKDLEYLRERVERIINTSFIPGTKAAFQVIGTRPPMEPTEANRKLFDHINKVSGKIGMGKRRQAMEACGSDAAYTVLGGAPSVCNMGIRGGKIHSTEEYAYPLSMMEKGELITYAILEMDDEGIA